MNLGRVADIIIEYSFYSLVLFVPLIWLPVTSELFEFNKITLTYILAILILGAWIIKSIHEQKLYLKRTPLDILLILFLVANILATIFSMDWHISIFGYYSRFNGGLLSTVTYIFLYYALVTHFDKPKVIRLLLVGLAASVLVSIYAIAQHPNPIFRGEDGSFRGIDQGYWDVRSDLRSFSFLGQPNWLAAYLSIFFFIGTSFLIIVTKVWQKLLLLASISVIFLGFTFAYSRGGTLGFIAGFGVFIFFLFVQKASLKKIKSRVDYIKESIRLPKLGKTWFWLLGLIVVMILVNFFFSNAFTKRGAAVKVTVPTVTQLEIEGKETAQIRFIVWKGAVEIFKNSPLFGSGVETFALSYYQYKPAEHNQTSEWDFLYNKAHNEYINYLATTGVVGTLTYLALIIFFSFLAVRWLFFQAHTKERFLGLGLLAAYVSYLVQNIFGFSVVIISILFFLSPGIFFILNDSVILKTKVLLSEKYFRFAKTELAKHITYGLTMVLTLALALLVVNSWVADLYFARGVSGSTSTVVYTNLKNALRLRPDEPLYLSELAGAEASIATQVEDADFANQLEIDAQKHIERALNISPNNLGVWRNKLRVYFELVKKGDKYLPEALLAAEKTTQLAPTDAKLHYNLALFYLLDETPDGINKSNETLIKVLGWRPEYIEARRQLASNYIEQGKGYKAKEHLEYILKDHPEDATSLQILESIE